MKLHDIYTKRRNAEKQASLAEQEYMTQVKKERMVDVQCNAIRIMMRGMHSLTEEANQRYFGVSLHNKHKHLVQLEPVAWEMYEKAKRERKIQWIYTKAAKNKYHRIRVEACRWMTLHKNASFDLHRRRKLQFPNEKPLERAKWVSNQELNLIIQSDCWSNIPDQRPGFHARVEFQGEVIARV